MRPEKLYQTRKAGSTTWVVLCSRGCHILGSVVTQDLWFWGHVVGQEGLLGRWPTLSKAAWAVYTNYQEEVLGTPQARFFSASKRFC